MAPYLLEHLSSLGDKKIVLLQPRRIAAKATATRIAQEHRWPLGGTVGYSVRFDSRTSQQTRLVVATEGILLRRLQADPILEDVGMVLLDEFHERSIAADLLLGMLRRIQMAVRPDLKIIVMSATLQAGPLKEFLSDAPVVEVSGSLYPVEVLYRPPPSNQKWLDHLCDTVVLTTQRSVGDILVFLPGMGEIAKSMDQLCRHRSMTEWELYPLHGNLPLEEQSKVLTKGDKPRVILATNVAETSLTIEGISTVIDSGWARVLRFDPQIGLDRLELEPICQASATQRAGRAGRVQAGTCIRLWDQASQSARPTQLDPEIRRVDLLGPLLQLHQWGEGTGEDFPWLQPPRPEAVQAAVALLEKLGAIRHGQITPLGTTMAQLPAPPRLARLLIEGHRRGQLEVIAWIAALLSERDPFRRQHVPTYGGMATRPTSYRCKSDVYERAIAVQRCARGEARTHPLAWCIEGQLAPLPKWLSN